MSRNHKKAIIAFLIVFAVALCYLRVVPETALSERAIVVGLGIDKTEKGYTVSCEIINPKSQSGGGQGESDGFALISGTGKTLDAAIGEISQKTGLKVSLSQCNLIVLGNMFLTEQTFPSVNYLVQTYAVPELAIIAVAENSAAELLKTKPVMTTLSALQMQKTLHSATDDASIISTNVKDFFNGYLSRTGVANVVSISAKKIDKNDVDKGSGESGDVYEYDYSKLALFINGKSAMLLEKDDTVAINYMKYDLKKGGETVIVDGEIFGLQITSKKTKYKTEVNGGVPSVFADVEIKARISEKDGLGKYFSVDEIPEYLTEKIAAAMKEVVEKKIVATFEKCKASGVDVYELFDKLYEKSFGDFKDESPNGDYLNRIRLIVNAKISVVKK